MPGGNAEQLKIFLRILPQIAATARLVILTIESPIDATHYDARHSDHRIAVALASPPPPPPTTAVLLAWGLRGFEPSTDDFSKFRIVRSSVQ